MNITPITSAEFPKPDWRRGRGKPLSPLGKAIRELVVGSGFSMPCEWIHDKSKRTGCPGTIQIHNILQHIRNRTGDSGHDATFRVRTRCKDGTFYVLRVEPN